MKKETSARSCLPFVSTCSTRINKHNVAEVSFLLLFFTSEGGEREGKLKKPLSSRVECWKMWVQFLSLFILMYSYCDELIFYWHFDWDKKYLINWFTKFLSSVHHAYTSEKNSRLTVDSCRLYDSSFQWYSFLFVCQLCFIFIFYSQNIHWSESFKRFLSRRTYSSQVNEEIRNLEIQLELLDEEEERLHSQTSDKQKEQ